MMKRKNMILGIMAVLPFLAMGQEKFTIKGHVGTASAPAKAYLVYLDGDQKVDSAVVSGGKFSFQGEVSQPGQAILALDTEGLGFSQLTNPDRVGLFLEGGEITVEGSDLLSKATIGGTPLNTDQGKLNKSLGEVMAQEAAFMESFQAATEAERNADGFMDNMDAKYQAIQLEKEKIYVDFIKANPNSAISLNSLAQLAGPSPDAEKIEPLLNSLSVSLQERAEAKELRNLLEISKTVQIGAMAPVFVQNDPDGKPVSLADFKGKYVLIDFWASWCAPCRDENPNLVAAYHAFKDKNFTVLGVSLDRETAREAWLKAIENDKLEWTQVSDLKFWQNEAAVLYGVRSIPQNYLLDPSGKIIAKNLRGEELHTRLAELLK